MLLSIIIVSWNTRELLADCLAAVASELAPFAPGATECFVVDNASSDGSAAMVRARFPWVRLLESSENLGFARGNNLALQQAMGEFVLLLNSDTRLHGGSLAGLVEFLARTPNAGAVGPKLLNGDGTLQPSCHPMLTPAREFWRLAFLDRLLPRATYKCERWGNQPHRVDVIKGACLMLRRQALEQVGFLDEEYFMYTEEMDLCRRLALKGWSLWYIPDAVVTHIGEASSKQVAERMYLELYRSKVQFHRKFGGEPEAIRFRRLVGIAYWPRLMVAAAVAPFVPRWRLRARTYWRLLNTLGEM